ncbi:hypothetical protein [Deinococcus actinosclerus]|uniref:hypothetical protein n=1 Tax=Deinococcus actinosclerus TaxID=1768108 RepID=UPI000A580E5B|nr:hypothetical protein [Deinococcus actinosclerus]
MTQTESLPITGRPTLRVVLAVPETTRAALAEQGVTAPAEVELWLQEATLRERAQVEQAQRTLGQQDPTEWLAGLLHKRSAAGTDLPVLRELILDMTPTTIAQLTQAYVTGRLADPKTLRAALAQTETRLEAALLEQLGNGEPSPSSPTGTASNPGSETNSNPAS